MEDTLVSTTVLEGEADHFFDGLEVEGIGTVWTAFVSDDVITKRVPY